MGLVLAAQSIASVVFLAVGGVAGDRLGRRDVLIFTNLLSLAATAALAAAALAGQLRVWELGIVTAGLGLASAFQRPAYLPLRKQLVEEQYVQAANALDDATGNAARLIGPSIGALIYVVAGAAGAFTFDAITFAIASISAALMRVANQAFKPRRGIWSDVVAGFKYFRANRWLWYLDGISVAANVMCIAPFMVLVPLIVRVHHYSIGLLGLTSGLQAAGAIGAGILIGQLRIRRRGVAFIGLATMIGLAAILLGLAADPRLIVAAGLILGIGIGCNVLEDSLLQQHVSDEYLSRVYGLSILSSFALMPLGYAAAGFLAAVYGTSPVLVVGGIAEIALATFIGVASPSIRQLA
jgi:MFS family permease